MNRGRRRESIFRKGEDFWDFLELVKKSMELWQVRVSAYCLMTNHYHILLQTLEPNLPRVMRHIDGVYTQKYNRKYGKDGTLFRGRYKAVLIEKEGFLIDVVRYIHQNPLKAGLEKHLGEYEWTSHRAYLSKAKEWEWITREIALSKLTWDSKGWRKAYLEFMSKDNREEIARFYSLKNLRSILGSSEFIQWVRDEFSDAIYNREVPDVTGLRCSAAEVVSAVARIYEVPEEDLWPQRRGTRNEARDMAIFLARKWTGSTAASIASMFGLTWHSSVSSAVRRVEEQVVRRRSLRSTMQEVEKILPIRQMTT